MSVPGSASANVGRELAGTGRAGAGNEQRVEQRIEQRVEAYLAGEGVEERVEASADVPAALEVGHVEGRHHGVWRRQWVGALRLALRHTPLCGHGADVEGLHRSVSVKVAAPDLRNSQPPPAQFSYDRYAAGSGEVQHRGALACTVGSKSGSSAVRATARTCTTHSLNVKLHSLRHSALAWHPASSGKPLQALRQTRFSVHFSSAMHLRARCTTNVVSRVCERA